jgi:hypothetical protein
MFPLMRRVEMPADHGKHDEKFDDISEDNGPAVPNPSLELILLPDKATISDVGTFRTCRDNLTMTVHRGKADIPPQGPQLPFSDLKQTSFAPPHYSPFS